MTLTPSDAQQVAAAIGDAIASGQTLDIRGHGSKSAVGAPPPCAAILDMSGLSGIVDYDPAELVLTVRPGTPLAEVEAVLADNGQMFAFEPLDLGPVLGSASGATIGGMVGAGLAGSRRLTRGSVRDHLLGFTAVSGRGELFSAGGKVVKNVTGYDLPKLMAGSWGRLAALTEITLKVLPAPPERTTRSISGLSPADARQAMARALGSKAEIAAAAYIPATASSPSRTLLRLEGVAPSIAARLAILDRLLADRVLEEEDGQGWTMVRRLPMLDPAKALWRLILPSRAMADIAAFLEQDAAGWTADWGGGLIWTDWSGDAVVLRSLLAHHGGHAMLLRSVAGAAARPPAFHPPVGALARIEDGVRRSFDPQGVFATGRFGDIRAD